MDPYDVLKVHRMDNKKTIKDAYRRLSKAYHPDKNPNDKEAEDRFKGIATAYEILSDPEKKKMFDEHGVVTTKDQMKRKAQALVQQCFQALIAQYGLERILVVDVMKEMRSLMDQGIVEVEKKIKESEETIRLIDKIINKFTFKDPKNPIQAMLDNDKAKHEATILQMNSEKVIAKRTYDLLKDYEFDADTAQFKPTVFRTYSTTTQTGAFYDNG